MSRVGDMTTAAWWYRMSVFAAWRWRRDVFMRAIRAEGNTAWWWVRVGTGDMRQWLGDIFVTPTGVMDRWSHSRPLSVAGSKWGRGPSMQIIYEL